MSIMTQFTEEQLNVMAQESSPRGRKARAELDRRKKQNKSEKVLDETIPSEDNSPEDGDKPKRTRRKRTEKTE